ncbi:MAG: zinc ABC transporter substrate-binding protein ZnuA [Rhodospirillales bacterium]|jgi:zinc transport system substrate-binding protein|nr:zinc ABC transporter substrate-binding protein ZnuA [Rhodospirillales bacterium]
MSTIGRALAILVIGVGLACRPPSSVAADTPAPAVVSSIPPVHSLVAAVMAGVGGPKLLVKGGSSPHTASLRPSDAAALQKADLVFWIGDGLEAFLGKSLAALPDRARVVALAAAPGVKLLPVREGGVWDAHPHAHDQEEHGHEEHGHGEEHDEAAADDEHGQNAHDMHIWLDPQNAKAMATAIADALAKFDPARADVYAGNAKALHQRLAALDEQLRTTLAPVIHKPYIVFHDAYQYFEARYGLSPAGAITFSPERAPGAKTLSEIRERIRTSGAVCVFREPQFEPGLVKTVTAGSAARIGVLDPVGADIPAGAEAYPALLTQMASAIRGCLGA